MRYTLDQNAASIKLNRKIQAEQLLQHLNEPKKTIESVWSLLRPRSPYIPLSIACNAVLFGIFDYLNQRNQFLIYSKEDYVFTDAQIRVHEPGFPQTMDGPQTYKTNSGLISLDKLNVLHNTASIIGCIFAFFFARSSLRQTISYFALMIFVSYAISQSYLFVFFDRIAYFIRDIFAKSISILTLRAAFEAAGEEKYRIYAISLGYYVNSFMVLLTLIIFKLNGHSQADSQVMYFTCGVSAMYAMICPEQLIQMITLRKIEKVSNILNTFGNPAKLKIINIGAMVDDILFTRHFPTGNFDAFAHLLKIKPFLERVIVLTILIAMQSLINTNEVEMIRYLLPYSPMESFLISRLAMCVATLVTIYLGNRIGRRPLLISLLSVHLLLHFYVFLAPVDTISVCFSCDRPNGEWSYGFRYIYICLMMLRPAIMIILILMTLEHIPSLYRAYVFPLVMLFDSITTTISDSTSLQETDNRHHLNYTSATLFYSLSSLLMAAICVGNTKMVFSTEDIKCYNVISGEEKTPEIGIEEKFRHLCEIKAAERAIFKKQQAQHMERYNVDERTYAMKRRDVGVLKGEVTGDNVEEYEAKAKQAITHERRIEENDYAQVIAVSGNHLRYHDDATKDAVKRLKMSRGNLIPLNNT